MTDITREALLALDDLPRQAVEVPEWGVTLYVRALTGLERDAWEASLVAGDQPDTRNIRARLVARTVVDANGVRLFADDDADALGNKSAAALKRLFDAALTLNALGREKVAVLAGE